MPHWNYEIDLVDIWGSDKSFAAKRDAIVERIRKSQWYLAEYETLRETVDNLEDSLDVDEFDSYWDELYDYADDHRAWIATF